jgi:hypothetical protein
VTLEELQHHEQVALIALLGLMARLDLQATPDEVELLRRVASEIGAERFEAASGEAARLPDGAAILRAASKVERPEAREVIFELLYDMAITDTIVEREGQMLDQLAELWGLPKRSSAPEE